MRGSGEYRVKFDPSSGLVGFQFSSGVPESKTEGGPEAR